MKESKSWTIPHWWPLTDGQAIVGFRLKFEFWFFPEKDQWKLSCHRNYVGDPILSLGPLRFKFGVSPFGINREFRDTEDDHGKSLSE